MPSNESATGGISGESYQILNTLAATLVLATLKSSPAEKELIGKEFTRTYEILSKRLAEIYAKASPERKLELDKASLMTIKQVVGQSSAGCCVGYPSAHTYEACVDNGGTWACKPAPIDKPLMPAK
jgi:hypothetical protein